MCQNALQQLSHAAVGVGLALFLVLCSAHLTAVHMLHLQWAPLHRTSNKKLRIHTTIHGIVFPSSIPFLLVAVEFFLGLPPSSLQEPRENVHLTFKTLYNIAGAIKQCDLNVQAKLQF